MSLEERDHDRTRVRKNKDKDKKFNPRTDFTSTEPLDKAMLNDLLKGEKVNREDVINNTDKMKKK